MIYLFIALFFLLLTFLFENKKEKRLIDFFYWIECLILILLAGFRYMVGGDTLGYMNMWEELPTLSELRYFDFLGANYQPLWYVVNAIAKSIYNDFTSFQFIHATLVNISIFVFIKKYSEYRFFAILTYYLMSFLYFNCEILRESMAICVFLFALPSLIEKKWIKYNLLITIAAFIHLSSCFLYLLPLLSPYFSKRESTNSLLYAIIVICIIFNPYIYDLFINFFFPPFGRYSKRAQFESHIIGYIAAFIRCLMIYILIYIRQRYNICNLIIDVGLKFYFLLSVTLIFLPIVASRFMNYFQILFIIALVDVFWKLRKKQLMIVSSIMIFFSLFTINYYTRDVSAWTGIKDIRFGERFYPYYSIFEDIPQDILDRRRAIYFQEELKR